jgi:hypothetical protein
MKFDIKIEGKKFFINGKRVKRIKTSGTRLCYKTSKYFLKIENEDDCSRSYLHQCRHEYRIWNKLSKEHKKYFVPILQYEHNEKYDYVVEPLILSKLGRRSNYSWEIIDKIAGIYKLNDLLYYPACNWFVTTKGNPIILDYGV